MRYLTIVGCRIILLLRPNPKYIFTTNSKLFFIFIFSTCGFLSLGSSILFLSSSVHSFRSSQEVCVPYLLCNPKPLKITSFSIKEVVKNEEGELTGSMSSYHIGSRMVKWKGRKNHKRVGEDAPQWKWFFPQLFFSVYRKAIIFSIEKKKRRG